MQSPKFKHKKSEIEAIISVPQLKARWKAKVRDFMRKQPVPDIVEHLDFHTSLDSYCTSIASDVASGTYVPERPARFLSEKSKGLCRQLVIPSVKDALVLQLLSDALWIDLKLKAPSKNAFYAPQDQKFSNPKGLSIPGYGPIAAFLSFQETIFGFASTKKFIVVTDIANYYDCISYDHLRNIIASLAAVGEPALDLLIYVLSHLLWQPDYMPRVQVGLPQMTLDAPRLLAHCFLFEIDSLITKIKDVEYARYMDDMDIGVDDINKAKEVLRDLDLSLQTRQVRLNSGKTQILSDAQARRHFRIRENNVLLGLGERANKKIKSSSSIERERKFVGHALSYGIRCRSFEEGNGEKIFRRLLGFAREWAVDFDEKVFIAAMSGWPNSRLLALLWWQGAGKPDETLERIRDLIAGGELVDDASIINIASALVSARLPASLKTDLLIKDMTSLLTDKSAWHLYAKIWIVSKYGTSNELMRIIEGTHSLWVTQEQLSRLVAGMLPRFLGTKLEGKFKNILIRGGNSWTRDISSFLEQVSGSAAGYNAVRKFLIVGNPGQPNRISHAKFLMVRAALSNTNISAAEKSKLVAVHGRAFSDQWYKRLI